MHRTRNAAYGQPYRGFESLPLRHAFNICGYVRSFWGRGAQWLASSATLPHPYKLHSAQRRFPAASGAVAAHESRLRNSVVRASAPVTDLLVGERDRQRENESRGSASYARGSTDRHKPQPTTLLVPVEG